MLRRVLKCAEIPKRFFGMRTLLSLSIANAGSFRNRKWAAPRSPALPTFTIVKHLPEGNLSFGCPVSVKTPNGGCYRRRGKERQAPGEKRNWGAAGACTVGGEGQGGVGGSGGEEKGWGCRGSRATWHVRVRRQQCWWQHRRSLMSERFTVGEKRKIYGESMEISKSLQEEILAVQNKLKNAIRDHQICVGKLKDDPNNTDILAQIQKIHLHIVSLGRCQKQVVQRLRKEVEAFKAGNANGAKVSIASLLGLNNNNHITNNNETKREAGSNEFGTKPSKDDYEDDIVRNGDVPSPAQDASRTKERPNSVETISGEDDVIEVSMDENSNEKQEEPEKECKIDSPEKLNFLSALGLITTVRYAELQNKRAERKRRSTANPQFVYSSLEVPTKRKRHSYLQSVGNVPQTRQTTARMNGPSPPPNKVASTKSTSLPTRTVMKSLIPVQKSTTRPNILRNVTESKVFVSKTKIENGPSQIQMPVPSVKAVQSVGNKAVHIPGLPSSLTIERIGNDSAVCIICKNPGTLTVCENCAANYHVSCHSLSPAPPRICPKCALIHEEDVEDGEEEGEDEMEESGRLPYKKDEELATAPHASGITRKAREDSEVYKATCGLYKADAAQKTRGISSAIGIGQLPSSTFLIPISSDNIPATSINQPEVGSSSAIDIEHRQSSISYPPIVLNQLPRSSIAYVQAEPQVSYAYPLPVSSAQPEKPQSYLIVKKLTKPSRRSSQSSGGQIEDQNHPSILNYQLPIASGHNSCVQTEISVAHPPMFFGKQLPESLGRGRKKQANRAVPALNRIVNPEKLPVPAEYKLDRAVFNGRKPKAKQSRNKLGINQLRHARATEILLPALDGPDSNDSLQISKSAGPEDAVALGGRSKHRPRTGGIFHSLFSGHNKSYIITDHSRESRGLRTNDKDHAVIRQQLHHQDYQLDSSEPDEPAAQLQRGALTKFFEHVKLEEAHLPAPSRAKLVYKSSVTPERIEPGGAGETSTEIVHDMGMEATVTRITLPTQIPEDDFVDQDIEQSSWLPKKVASKKRRSSENVTKSVEAYDRVADMASRASDFASFERKHGNTYIRVRRDSEDVEENALNDVFRSDVPLLRCAQSRAEIIPDNRTGRRTPVSLRNAQSNLLELRNEVSVPEDKADTEKQDLPSGRRSTGSNGFSSSNSDSDTPEQAMNNPMDRPRRLPSANEYEERLDIDTVSPESMQVLEQFETAMLETDHSNAATC
ncbi:hypothetical protein KM043_005991 [Ampulex compressa]|nr:hypothetical protein KM043_005991 [Ampulex compressa]